jgi:hypothetical protein
MRHGTFSLTMKCSSLGVERKKSQLGMPYGTAMHILRKRIMFTLIKRCRLDACHVCGSSIESDVDLSIEHIKPWEGKDTALFWDLANIAFSHRSCNRPHRYGARSRLRIGPSGTAWCSGCQSFLEVAAFFRNASKFSGWSDYCKVCEKHPNNRRGVRKRKRSELRRVPVARDDSREVQNVDRAIHREPCTAS